MSGDDQLEFLIQGYPGSSQDFDPTAPPRKITAKGSLQTGGLYLRATLKEMKHIRELCEDLDRNHRELLQETKAEYFRWVDRQDFLSNSKVFASIAWVDGRRNLNYSRNVDRYSSPSDW